MENDRIAVRILETTRRIDRLVRGEVPAGRSVRLAGPQSQILVDLDACLAWLCDELEGKSAARGLPRSEPVLPKVAGSFLELIEGLDALFWLADIESSRLLYVSRGCAGIWGRSASELRERPDLLEAGIHPEDRARVLRGDEAGLRRGPARDEACRVFRPDGDVRHVRIRTVATDARGTEARVVGIAEDVTAQQEAEEQSRRDRAELRALASELVLTEEHERRNLATDLHDGAHQVLELARIKLGSLGSPEALQDPAEAVKEIEGLLELGLESLRSLTFELSPPVLHDLGLPAALQWLADDLARCRGLDVQVEDDGRAKPLDERNSVLLFRSARELLINVAKHARVSRARVATCRRGEEFVLVVEDEGAGFEPERLPSSSQGGGYGLFSIRQRLAHAGGGMEVCSGVGRGTRVVLSVALAPHRRDGGAA